MQISLVIPAFNEEESLPELSAWIRRVMDAHQLSYEVWFIDDGSRDQTWAVIEKLSEQHPQIHGIRFRRNYGKSAALNVGFKAAQGDVVITMDADLQDSPDEIPELYKMVVKDGFDLVSGWKQKRFDNALTKNLPSKLYNSVTSAMSGVKLHDMNCGLKAYRQDVIKTVEVYGEMHRYIPVLAKQAGFLNIGEKVVQHQARKYGVSKFGMSRFLYGPLDLLSVMFMTRFSKKPMHIFGGLGVASFFLGFIILTYLSIAKLVFEQYRMTERPIFYFGLLTIVIGTQLFLTGFLAELISRTASDRDQYEIAASI
ncbi:MAG: glycosyltransferase family 2 protein [Chitinophagales bacterium]